MPSLARLFGLRQTPVLASLASRSSSHRAQLGVARPAHEAALRKRLASPLKELRSLSAAPTGQPALAWLAHAIPGAALWASPNPSLAIRGEPFGPQRASFFVGCADRASPLPLFVAGFGAADHPDDAIAFDDLAVAANPLDRCSHFHDIPLFRNSARFPTGRKRRAGTSSSASHIDVT